MGIENTQGYGSMFGVVDSLRNMTQAMEELLKFLPEDFVWPTHVDISPFSAYVEWGRDNSYESGGESMWMVADPNGVNMNANFRLGWPECGAANFDAEIAAGWLKELTKNWEWDAHRGATTGSMLRRVSMNANEDG